jgi:hypothetical protein
MTDKLKSCPSIFDLLEPLSAALLENGGPDIRTGFARATGGADIPYLVAAIAAYESAVGERVERALAVLNDSSVPTPERVRDARAALTSTDATPDIAKLGTVSLTSFDGHCVRIDFPNREDAERMYAVLTSR